MDKGKIGDKDQSAVKKELSEKVEMTEDVSDKKVYQIPTDTQRI